MTDHGTHPPADGPVGPEPVSDVAPALANPHLLRQRWLDVTFLHWAVPPDRVARLLPPGVRPDVLDGRSYVGLVLFRMVGIGFARGPVLPWLSPALETNVRVYSVDRTGRRGVVFLGLDTDSAPLVAAGRAGYGLPYRWARMGFDAGDGSSTAPRTYTARLRRPFPRASSRVRVRPSEEVLAGPLESFLTARWGLHVARFGRTWHLPNTHEAWPLRCAEVLEVDDQLVASLGLGDVTGREPDHVAFSAGVTARFGRPGLATVARRPGPHHPAGPVT